MTDAETVPGQPQNPEVADILLEMVKKFTLEILKKAVTGTDAEK